MGSETTFKEVSGSIIKNISVCVHVSKKEQQKLSEFSHCLMTKSSLITA